MFPFFRPENAVESRNIPHFPILRYLDPRQVVVDSEALLSPLTLGVGRLEAAVKRRRKNIDLWVILRGGIGLNPL